MTAVPNPYRCCANDGKPGHPRGDPTMSAHCAACGIYTRQWWNGRGYECAQCAIGRYHAKPPAEVPATAAPKRTPLVADEPVGDPTDPVYAWMFDPGA